MTSNNTILSNLLPELFIQVQHLGTSTVKTALRRVIALETIEQRDNGQGISLVEFMNYLHDNDCRFKSRECTQPECLLNKTAQELFQDRYKLNDDSLLDLISSKFKGQLKQEEINKVKEAILSPVMQVSREIFNTDLLCLCKNKFLVRKQQVSNSGWRYYNIIQSGNNISQLNPETSNTDAVHFNAQEQLLLCEVLTEVNEYHPAINGVIDKISSSNISSIEPRLLFRPDTIISNIKGDEIEDIYQRLDESWGKQLVSYEYTSASQDGTKSYYQVYPVCTAFYKKALYLYAWGLNPDGKEDWYPYRLDRISLESWKNIEWNSLAFDSDLLSKYKNDDLPSSYEVSDKLREAWGHKIGRKPQSLILRFNQEYYDLYIKDTTRVASKVPVVLISGAEAIELIKGSSDLLDPHSIESQKALKLIDRIDRYPDAPYFTVLFRPGDNYTVMQLRAWSDKVEVIAPFDLREKMIEDANKAIVNYK